jgi:hypothetical protein
VRSESESKSLVDPWSALGTRDEPAIMGQRSPKLPAGADAQLGEHLAP